jgi:hypothetical protein
MKVLRTCFLMTAVCGLLACGNLMADTVTLSGLPGGDVDTLSIALDPLNGAVDGIAGSSVGWGFTVDWTSTDADWISFTGSSLGSLDQNETNPSLLASYTDFIGLQGGPVDFALAPGIWTESYDGVSQGAGLYQITTDPSAAEPGALDSGEMTFFFQVYNGDPFSGGVQTGDDSYSYYGPSSAFSVSVDAPAGPVPTPEPPPLVLLLVGGGVLIVGRRHLVPSGV